MSGLFAGRLGDGSLPHDLGELQGIRGGCSEGPCKEGTIGNPFPQKGILTKQGTYVMAILGTGILSNYHLGERPCSAVMLHLPACTKRPPHFFSGSGFKVSLNPMGARDCMLRPQSTYPCSKPFVSQVHATM